MSGELRIKAGPAARRQTWFVLTLVLVLTALGAGRVSAHVVVDPSTAAPGSFATLTFRVPNESDTAGTVAVQIALPVDHPFASVSYKAVPGWTGAMVEETLAAPVVQGDLTITEAVRSITWTAEDGTSIGPGQFAEFEVSAGPVPDVPTLLFPAVQTYDDGEVVRWDQPTPDGGAEPAYPAPTLSVGGVDASTGDTAASGTEAGAGADGSGAASDAAARTLAVAGILVGALGLLVAAISLRRRPAVEG